MVKLHATPPLEPNLKFDLDGSSLAFEAEARIAKISNGKTKTEAQSAAAAILGFDPPSEVGVTASGTHYRIANIAPGEWLVFGDRAAIGKFVEAMEVALHGKSGLVVDISHGRAVLRISGPHARDCIASLCPLDLRLGQFPVGTCARSILGETGAYIELLDDAPDFVVVVDQSQAGYAWDSLSEALLFATPQSD